MDLISLKYENAAGSEFEQELNVVKEPSNPSAGRISTTDLRGRKTTITLWTRKVHRIRVPASETLDSTKNDYCRNFHIGVRWYIAFTQVASVWQYREVALLGDGGMQRTFFEGIFSIPVYTFDLEEVDSVTTL